MKRRAFLSSTAAAAVGLMLRRAFADASLPAAKTGGAAASAVLRVDLEAALARAASAGVPLFVIVVPTEDGRKYEVGRAWGELLNHGTPAQVAPLARAEVVCARMDELAKVSAPGVSGAEPLAVVVDPASRRVTSVLHATLRAYEKHVFIKRVAKPGGSDDTPKPLADDQVSALRIEALAGVVRSGLLPIGGAEVPALAAGVKTKLVERPPPGSRWANSSGCGPTRVEQTPEEKEAERRAEQEALAKGIVHGKTVVAYGCGMGHVPAKGRRFLYFFAKLEED
jgi:hypothetical protein